MAGNLSWDNWRRIGAKRGWAIQPVPWWATLWGVRHVRFIISAWDVKKFEGAAAELGLQLDGYERWVLYAIRRGWQ